MADKKKSAGFLRFFVTSLIICYIASGLVWSILLATRTPWYCAEARLQDHVNTLILNVLPLSLPPLAVSTTVCGIFKKRLNLLEIFLSGWYISTFEILGFFYLAASASHGRVSYPQLGFVFLSSLIAVILTTVQFHFWWRGRRTL